MYLLFNNKFIVFNFLIISISFAFLKVTAFGFPLPNNKIHPIYLIGFEELNKPAINYKLNYNERYLIELLNNSIENEHSLIQMIRIASALKKFKTREIIKNKSFYYLNGYFNTHRYQIEHLNVDKLKQNLLCRDGMSSSIEQHFILFRTKENRKVKLYLSKIRSSILIERPKSEGYDILAVDSKMKGKYISCFIRMGSWKDILKI